MKRQLIKLMQQVKNNITKQQLFLPTETLVVAASAGVDSQVLLASLAQLHAAPKIIVAHINHDMRAQAATEATFVAQQAKQYGFKYEELIWPQTQHPKHGIEAAGREVRYRFLAQIAAKYHASKILTAHHANDVAETFLMKLMRGGRWEQLGSIQWTRAFNAQTDIVRPLLNIPKKDLIAYAHQNNLQWYEDASNQDLNYTRNRIRHTLLPQMITENPQAVSQLNQYARQITHVDEMVTEQVELYLKTVQQTQYWDKIPKSWFQATLKAYLAVEVPNVSIKENQLHQIENLYFNVTRPNGKVVLNKEYELVKTYQKIALIRRQTKVIHRRNSLDNVITLNKWYLLPNGGKFIVKQKVTNPHNLNNSAIIIPIHLEDDAWPLRLRYRKDGDAIGLKNGHQKVARVLIDAKVPFEERDAIPLLTDAHNQVLWVVDYKANWVRPDQVNYEVIYIPDTK
ncbi:tRNA(Ile)-lysidine synthase [Periweissella fabaria]|uniref:tRNA(Ile)-lysidine synthase n=2 Tax=Periweissella fabaria TaxID=546157 RepID=A0ABM8Z550_9LACO|nr:tRNA(Ile)-lysidine synthase [Periweissella fabaria]